MPRLAKRERPKCFLLAQTTEWVTFPIAVVHWEPFLNTSLKFNADSRNKSVAHPRPGPPPTTVDVLGITVGWNKCQNDEGQEWSREGRNKWSPQLAVRQMWMTVGIIQQICGLAGGGGDHVCLPVANNSYNAAYQHVSKEHAVCSQLPVSCPIPDPSQAGGSDLGCRAQWAARPTQLTSGWLLGNSGDILSGIWIKKVLSPTFYLSELGSSCLGHAQYYKQSMLW